MTRPTNLPTTQPTYPTKGQLHDGTGVSRLAHSLVSSSGDPGADDLASDALGGIKPEWAFLAILLGFALACAIGGALHLADEPKDHAEPVSVARVQWGAR